MSLKTHSLVSSSLKASYLAVTLALALPATTYAAVLGDIHVISSFGQPFKAEIPLSNVSKREGGKLVPGLGKPEDYQRSNADFNAAYASLQFNVVKRGDQQFVEITSATPMNVSLYDLVVELRGGIQRQVKQYSFMMDSALPDPAKKDADPEAKTEVATPVVAPPPAPISSPVTTPVDQNVNNADQDKQLAQQVVKAPAGNQSKDQPISSVPQPIPAAPKEPVKSLSGLAPQNDKDVVPPPKKGAAQPKHAGIAKAARKDVTKKSFVVSRGDILGTISQQIKPRSVSLNQMMVALLRANPDAFVDNNINRLRSGTVLRIPSDAEVSSIDAKEANQIVIAQINDFDRYRQALANHVANSRADKTKNSQRANGKVALHVNEEKNKDQPQDRLTLSKAGKAGGKKEEHIASKKALEDADSRVKALEKNVADLQKLLALKNQALAEAQSKSDDKDASTSSADNKNPQLDKQGFFASVWDGIKHGWKRFANFVGSLNDIPHFVQIAVGFLIALIAILIGLIISRVRKNKKPVPEEVKDDTAYTAVAAGAAGAALATDDENNAAGKTETPPVDIAQKIDFDLNLDNAQSAAEAAPADNEPVLDTTATDNNAVAEEPVVQDNAVAQETAPIAEPAAPEPAPAAVEEPVQPAPVAEPEVAPEPTPAPAEAPAETTPAAPAAEAAPQPTAESAAPANNEAEEEKLELDIPAQVDENGMPTPEQAQRDELTMKLDLASAYQEIGDTEGAKELLEEIINSNNPDFAAQAKQKLAALQNA